jgi:hypothetical protein
MNFVSPLVDLRIDIEQCFYIVYVNGGVVASDMGGRPAHEDDPINHFVRSGDNELTVYMLEGDEPTKCDVKVAVNVSDSEDESGRKATALTLAYAGEKGNPAERIHASSSAGLFDSNQTYKKSDRGDLAVGPVQVKEFGGRSYKVRALSRSFSLQLPFPEWAFFKGEKLREGWEYQSDAEMDAVSAEIQAAYASLHDMLEKKEIDRFLDACEERSQEIDLAFYKARGATRARLRKDIEAAIGDPAYKLKPVVRTGKHWTYNIGSTGKLISLTTGARSSAILRFTSETSDLDLIFPVTFRKEGSRFIVTR